MIQVTGIKPEPMVKLMTDWHETVIRNSFSSADFFQRRMTKMTDIFWDQASWTTKIMSNAMIDWNMLCFENILKS